MSGFEFRVLGFKSLRVLLLVGLCVSSSAGAEPTELPADLLQAVQEGRPEVLARFGETSRPEECRLLAQAYANLARRVADATERSQACQRSAEWYERWIAAVDQAAKGDTSPQTLLEQAAARLEYASMVMNLQAAGELDRFEITAGQQGDRAKLLAWLGTARIQCRRAELLIEPVHSALRQREDEFLAAGIYDSIVQTKFDAEFNDAWAGYYCAVLDERNQEARLEALSDAENAFRMLLEAGRAKQARGRCLLGLALAQRELGRLGEAERNFAAALKAESAPLEAARIRYEWARCHLASGKFAEARAVLRPLLELATAEPSPEQQVVQFYINLARLWDANSYLLEARALEAEAGGAGGDPALRQQAQQAREIALRKFEVMAARGGPWPALVQLYIGASIDLNADPQRLSPGELLYAARHFAEAGQLEEARQRLEAALGRPEFALQKSGTDEPRGAAPGVSSESRELAGQLLFELAKCYYRLDRPVDAAETFDVLSREYRSHRLAPQAATFAYQLWAEVAQSSRSRSAYERLAETLVNLIQSFADHPQRQRAAWLLPVAWQAAGRYAAAADEFAKVGRDSQYWEEAQGRLRVCRRLALEQRRAELSGAEFQRQARALADELTAYADQALQRAAAGAGDAQQARSWSAEARVSAAELLVGQDDEAALAALERFDEQYPHDERVGRVLAVRIRALRGLKRFDEAARVLGRYLEAVSAEQSGPVLNLLTRGMQEEVERLTLEGEFDAARRLALESLPAFEQLERWVRQEPSRAAAVAPATLARAQMLYTAGELEQARERLVEILANDAHNGHAQRLLALVLTAQLPPAGSGADAAELRADSDQPKADSEQPRADSAQFKTDSEQPKAADSAQLRAASEQLKAAQEAWAVLLKDSGLRQRSPEHYWEARYNWLALLLRQGKAAEVEQAIDQEQVWYPALGGANWREKLLKLRDESRSRSLKGE